MPEFKEEKVRIGLLAAASLLVVTGSIMQWVVYSDDTQTVCSRLHILIQPSQLKDAYEMELEYSVMCFIFAVIFAWLSLWQSTRDDAPPRLNLFLSCSLMMHREYLEVCLLWSPRLHHNWIRCRHPVPR
jgi:hypothetical protein